METAVTDSSTSCVPVLKLGGLMARVMAIEGGVAINMLEIGLWRFVRMRGLSRMDGQMMAYCMVFILYVGVGM